MFYEDLCREVEERIHREMKTPQDFELLSERVMEKIHEKVSTSTLMRMWGYRRSVSTRMSTLDIMARFLDYDDYGHFRFQHGGEEAFQDELEFNERQRGRRQRKWMFAVTLVLVAIVGGVFILFFGLHREEQQEPVYVTSLEQLSNHRQYYIHTRNAKRGTMGVDSHQLATTYSEAKFYHCDTTSTFALIRYEDFYYLYSISLHRFINVLLAATDDPLRHEYGEINWCAIDIRPEEGHFVMDFWGDKAAGKVFTLNVNAGNGLIITDWGTMNAVYDDGNLFSFEDAGPFDPTEALEMLQKSQTKTSPEIES